MRSATRESASSQLDRLPFGARGEILAPQWAELALGAIDPVGVVIGLRAQITLRKFVIPIALEPFNPPVPDMGPDAAAVGAIQRAGRVDDLFHREARSCIQDYHSCIRPCDLVNETALRPSQSSQKLIKLDTCVCTK